MAKRTTSGKLTGLKRTGDGKWAAAIGDKKIVIAREAPRRWVATGGRKKITAGNFRQMINTLRHTK